MFSEGSKGNIGKKKVKTNFLILPVPIPDEERKLTEIFILKTSLWRLKRFYEGLKGSHREPFEGPQRIVKIKI